MALIRVAVAAALTVGIAACADNPAQLEEADRIEIVSGADQVGEQGALLAGPVVVRVIGGSGEPLSGAPVEWRVIEGGGSVVEAERMTDGAGEARATWMLGLLPGQNLLLVSARGTIRTVRATTERRFAAVTAGGRHTCALSTLGEALCWGANNVGQLGDGTDTGRAVPTVVKSNLRFRVLSAGWSHSCGVTVGGDVYCWGDNREGQLGIGSPQPRAHAPVRAVADVRFTDVTAGFIHSCAIAESGEAYCWGGNDQRQLGTGDAQRRSTPSRVAPGSPAAAGYTRISAGEFHTCAISTDERAYCWGWSSTGEVGNGSPFDTYVAGPAEVAGGLRFTAVAAGIRHTCAATTEGIVYCWGRNAVGEIGTPPHSHEVVPVRVRGPFTMHRVGAGNVHSCGVGSDPGTTPAVRFVYCWGSDGYNHIGATPAPVFGEPDLTLAVGFGHACTVREGAVWCWGSNGDGRLGVTGIPGSAAAVKASQSPQ